MSTHCVVAVPDEDRIFRGRYVHHDGYPAGAGAEVAKIVHRDGWRDAVRVLIYENLGWSTIRANQQPGAESVGKNVPGYGIAYTEDQEDSFFTPHDVWCDWAYVLRPEGITVWGRQNAVWVVQPIRLVVT